MPDTPLVPNGAVDTHVHAFDPDRFPYAEPRSYTPGRASIEDLQAMHAGLGVSRVVLVQPSVYGTDNRCLVDALGRLGPDVARGIVVVDPVAVTDAELDAFSHTGVVGIRVNLSVAGERRAAAAVRAVSEALDRVGGSDLLVQIYVDLPLVDALEDTIARARVPVVLDHFAGARAEPGPAQPGFDALGRLLDMGHVWVKLSAPYRESSREPDYPDLVPIARALVERRADRLVWGSDWPHTGGGSRGKGISADVEPFRVVDNAHMLTLLAGWIGSEDTQRKVFVDNAVRLFRF